MIEIGMSSFIIASSAVIKLTMISSPARHLITNPATWL
jgi:hypothetical protein